MMKLIVSKIRYYLNQRKQKENIKRDFIIAVKKRRHLKIVIGDSQKSQNNWISSESFFLNLLKEKEWQRYFSDNSIDALLAEHVWEHLTLKQGIYAAKLCFKYLKKNGYIRIAVPDGLFPNTDYINHVSPGSDDPDASDHKVLYTYKSLSNLFRNAGYKIVLLEYFDEKGEFHFKKWNSSDGLILRSRIFDKRNVANKINYTSIILDAIKPL